MQSQKLHSYLYQAALAFALMGLSYSCRMDDPNKSSGAQDKPKAPAVTMPIDLGDVEIDPATAIQYASPKMTVRGIEMNIPTRETETTPDGKTKIVPPTFSFTVADGKTEEDFPVFIALFGERHQKGCYGKATWKLVKETKDDGTTRYFVKTKTTITFEENFAPDTLHFNNGEDWRLHAIYAPDGEWDATTQTYKWSAKKVVKKLYAPGDKLTIGKDIDIPFVLGYRSNKWNTGYPVKAVHSKYWNFEAVQQYGDDAHTQPLRARFRMLGSLYALRLKNDMRADEPLTADDMDGQILGQLQYRPTYDFTIRGFYVESTQAVTSVAYDFSGLYHDLSPTEQSQPAALSKGMKRDITLANAVVKETPQEVPSQTNPTRLYLPFDEANYADLDRQSTTKTLYFWMSEVDATGKIPNAHDGYGTSIWANLYNKTMKFQAGHTFVYTAKSAHKSGYAYSSLATLKEELRINPIGRMGLGYASMTPNVDPHNPAVTCYFVRADAPNCTPPSGPDPGSGSSYAYAKGTVQLKDIDDKRFKVSYIGTHEGTLTMDYGNLYWQMPDRYDLFSVFPYMGKMPGVSGGRWAEGVFYNPVAGAITPVFNDEQARIDGRIYRNLRSVYYRKVATQASEQTGASSRNVTYAFRFIGTPMAVAVRYTEIGRWFNSGTFTSNTQINPDSRFRIEMKPIGNAYRYKDLSDAEAKNVLLNEIARDGYWETSDGMPHPELVSRTIHLNGMWKNGTYTYGGQSFYIWTRRLSDQYNSTSGRVAPGIYQNLRVDNDGMHWRLANTREYGGVAGFDHIGLSLLPWLAVDQSAPQ